jgi:hypothetical protein
MTTETLYFAIIYTILVLIISIHYWFKGRNYGIKMTIATINQYEPEAIKRFDKKIKEKLNVGANTNV